MTMQNWVRSTRHPLKRKLRWVMVGLAWALVAAWVVLMLIGFIIHPWMFVFCAGVVALSCLTALVEWVFEKDEEQSEP